MLHRVLTVRQVRFAPQRSLEHERSWRCTSDDSAVTQQDEDNVVLPRLLTLLTEHQIAELHTKQLPRPLDLNLLRLQLACRQGQVGRATQQKQKTRSYRYEESSVGVSRFALFRKDRCIQYRIDPLHTTATAHVR